VRYTNSWMRPQAEEDGGTFRVWQTDFGPPSHSIPPLVLYKAAERIGRSAAVQVSERLYKAYFTDNLDITDPATMLEIWRESGLDEAAFEAVDDPALLQEVLNQHNDAVQRGVTGVPAIMLDGTDAVITGAHPRALYRRWIERTLERGRG
jgi:predicted DsbA family dithiol-disulfide isomerase